MYLTCVKSIAINKIVYKVYKMIFCFAITFLHKMNFDTFYLFEKKLNAILISL